MFIGIIAACAPCLKVFFERTLRRVSLQISSIKEAKSGKPAESTVCHDAGIYAEGRNEDRFTSIGYMRGAEGSRERSTYDGVEGIDVEK
jgi:hypothetical protein